VGGVPGRHQEPRRAVVHQLGDAAALSGALTRLLSDPAGAGRLGRAGWARVRSRHDPAAHVAALQEVYRRVAR
jgi:glycosyltransferase involved in cell wall biosynthesis